MTLLTGACSGSERDEVAVVTSPDPNSMVFCIVFVFFCGDCCFPGDESVQFQPPGFNVVFFVMICFTSWLFFV